MVSPSATCSSPPVDDALRIGRLIVAPTMRGEGWGRRLLLLGLDHARARGVSRVQWGCWHPILQPADSTSRSDSSPTPRPSTPDRAHGPQFEPALERSEHALRRHAHPFDRSVRQRGVRVRRHRSAGALIFLAGSCPLTSTGRRRASAITPPGGEVRREHDDRAARGGAPVSRMSSVRAFWWPQLANPTWWRHGRLSGRHSASTTCRARSSASPCSGTTTSSWRSRRLRQLSTDEPRLLAGQGTHRQLGFDAVREREPREERHASSVGRNGRWSDRSAHRTCRRREGSPPRPIRPGRTTNLSRWFRTQDRCAN